MWSRRYLGTLVEAMALPDTEPLWIAAAHGHVDAWIKLEEYDWNGCCC